MEDRLLRTVAALRVGVSSADLSRVLTLAAGLLVTVLGCVYALYTPPFQVPDEPAHFFRTYQLTSGVCREPPASALPADIPALMKQFPNQLNQSEAVDDLGARLAAAAHRPRDARSVTIPRAATAAGYSCLTYVPAGAGAALALAFGLPIIDVLFAARLGNVVAFGLLATLALLLLPAGLRPFTFLLVAMPMALAEAGSTGQDAVVNGVSLLFVAYVAHLAWAPRARPIGPRDTALLIGLAALLGQCKLNFMLVPLVLLVPRARWRDAGWQLGTLGATCAAAVVTFALWQRFGATSAETSPLVAADYAANVHYLLHAPHVFLDRLGASLKLNWWFYIDSFVGRLGWLDVYLWPPAVVAYAGALVVAALAAPAPPALTWPRRGLCLGIAGGLVGVTFLVFWVVATPVRITDFAMGTSYIEGVQGRYFIPYALPLAFVVAGLGPALGRRLRAVPAGWAPPLTWALPVCAVVVLGGSSAAYAALYEQFVYPQQEVGKIPARLRHPARYFEGKFIHQVGAPDQDQVFFVLHGRRYWIETPRWFRKQHLSGLQPPVVDERLVRRIPLGETVYDADLRFYPTRTAVQFANQFAVDRDGAIWLVINGVRHKVLDNGYVRDNGYPVVALTPAQFADIPVGDDIENFNRLNGQVIQATDAADPVERARVYVVQRGVKHWILQESWLTRHGKRLDQARALPSSVVDRIPEGAPFQ
jgi:uncharacterized membrane protein